MIKKSRETSKGMINKSSETSRGIKNISQTKKYKDENKNSKIKQLTAAKKREGTYMGIARRVLLDFTSSFFVVSTNVLIITYIRGLIKNYLINNLIVFSRRLKHTRETCFFLKNYINRTVLLIYKNVYTNQHEFYLESTITPALRQSVF